MFLIQALIFVFSLLIGLILFFNPAGAIEIQRRFYEKINWRITPISMPKEIRNTRIMGMALIAASVITVALILKR